ncbi:MAG: serine/threonine protein kinase [Bradymonadia bacterium]|jgi:serine/threonine protein kinase
MESLINTRLGEYVITQCIATGGMSAIFEARHHRTGDRVAVKILSRELRDQGDPLARILQEGRVITSLLHEHIVRVFDYGTADENIGFVVMELLDGQSLAEVLEAEKHLSTERTVFIGRQVCNGLAAAHARDVYHRDIKPGNIVLADGQRHRDFVKLLDFGIAKLGIDDPAKIAATAKGMTLGTPQYMSPEQAQGAHIDARSDIYQVGLLLYELLVGEPPFEHPNAVSVMAMHLSATPRPIRERRPSVPVELEAIVQRCLAKRPVDRFQTADDLAIALDALARRITMRDRARVRVDDHSIAAGLHLPTLGSPADLERFAHNLADVLEQLWPKGDVPAELRDLQGEIWDLNEEHLRVGTDLAVVRSDSSALARSIEERLRPLERAIGALEGELERLRKGSTGDAEEAQRQGEAVNRLDAEYARIYEEIEQHQDTLYAAADARTSMVDFRDLFREDIAAQLDRLETIFGHRCELAERMQSARVEQAGAIPRIADLEVQLCELSRSRLVVESERATRLAEMQLALSGLEGKHHALERALEHHNLKLGLAFRRAISDLLTLRVSSSH